MKVNRIFCMSVPATLLLAACGSGLPAEEEAAQIDEEAAMFEQQAESRTESLNQDTAPYEQSEQLEGDGPGTTEMLTTD